MKMVQVLGSLVCKAIASMTRGEWGLKVNNVLIPAPKAWTSA
jgi:hypothetical protein